MKVSEALATRLSCRAFLDTPVPEATVRAILDACRRAPSGGNLQPWFVHVVTGRTLKRLIERVQDRLAEYPRGEGAEFRVYPEHLDEVYRERRFQCGEDLYATLGIPREDKAARRRQFSRNYTLFGAPVGLFFCLDRQMGPPQWADLGIFLQSVMLLAREYGLHTCPQEAWALWPKTVGEVLRLPDNQMLFCGMALGYMDEDAPVNRLRTRRAPLEEFVTFHAD